MRVSIKKSVCIDTLKEISALAECIKFSANEALKAIESGDTQEFNSRIETLTDELNELTLYLNFKKED